MRRCLTSSQNASATGEGFVIATGPTEYLLLVGLYAVVVLVVGDVAHIDAIRRA
jgi:hypothetical protein